MATVLPCLPPGPPDPRRALRDAIDAMDAARLAMDRARRALGAAWVAIQPAEREWDREAAKLVGADEKTPRP